MAATDGIFLEHTLSKSSIPCDGVRGNQVLYMYVYVQCNLACILGLSTASNLQNLRMQRAIQIAKFPDCMRHISTRSLQFAMNIQTVPGTYKYNDVSVCVCACVYKYNGDSVGFLAAIETDTKYAKYGTP